MRIGIIGDIHGNVTALRKVLEVLSDYDADILLLVGDIGSNSLPPQFDPGNVANLLPQKYRSACVELREKWQDSVLHVEELVTSLGVPVYLVPGNHDLPYYPIANSKLVSNCDHRLVETKGIQIIGWGGSPKTPAGWPYEWTNSKAEKVWRKLALPSSPQPRILLSHSPPSSSLSPYVGWFRKRFHSANTSFIGKLIEYTSPSICVCGHIHNEYSIKHLGQTLVISEGNIVRRPAAPAPANSSERGGYQARLLNCNDNLEEIEAVNFFIPLEAPHTSEVKRETYRFHSQDSREKPGTLTHPGNK